MRAGRRRDEFERDGLGFAALDVKGFGLERMAVLSDLNRDLAAFITAQTHQRIGDDGRAGQDAARRVHAYHFGILEFFGAACAKYINRQILGAQFTQRRSDVTWCIHPAIGNQHQRRQRIAR